MTGLLIFVISIILIGICFVAASHSSGSGGSISKKITTIPEELQKSFKEFADGLLAGEGIILEDCRITQLELLSEVPYDNGVFKYYKMEYSLTPENVVQNAHGLVLNSKEIFAKAGINDELVILYYIEENEETGKEEIFETSFMPQKRVTLQGFKAYIESRYRNVKEKLPMEEYAFVIDGNKLTLWDNLLGKKPIEEATAIKQKAEGQLAYGANYINRFTTEDLEVDLWVHFERKKELIYKMEAHTYKVETPRGIHVGDTIERLKEKYAMSLSYVENLDEQGPAYGYIPEDGSNRYIVFRVQEELISEIIITDGFDSRPFTPKDGYVDQDVPWIEVDYSGKLTEKYARALYLGQHKADLEARQVFNTFIANNFEVGSVIDKGLWKEYEDENEELHFAIYKNAKEEAKFYVEVKLKQLAINTFTNDTDIWVVTHYRVQKKRG